MIALSWWGFMWLVLCHGILLVLHGGINCYDVVPGYGSSAEGYCSGSPIMEYAILICLAVFFPYMYIS